jgi:thioredoxin reductase/Pyruvate/2-oxoacid:ferredoxin oxidoreductase delta subunit
METLFTFLLAGLVTLFFVRGYLKQLTKPKSGRPLESSGVRETRPCPRCSKPVEKRAAFCEHCGAAMVMWTVHQAQQVGSSSGTAASGAPKPVINASMCIGCGSCVHACPETGTLELEAGKAILAHPERCTGHSKCAEVCPTQAITLSVGGVLQTMRVPLVRENFETNVSGVFIVGELSGMGLIKTAINEGKLVVDYLRERLQADGGTGSGEMYDIAIVGAGPAGLSASLTAQQYGLRYVTLEQGEIAATIRQYPRQKFLMAEPIQIPLYGTLYVGDGTKEALLSVWETIIANTGVQIRTNEKVEQVQKNSAGFHVRTALNDYKARYVVLALGKRGTPRRLGIEGEELPKVAYRLIEVDSYQDKDILVVGGGDSALEAALALSRSGTNRVTLSYRAESFHRARERNRDQLRKAELEGRLRVLRQSSVQQITQTTALLACPHGQVTLPNDYAFLLLGGESPEEFLRRTGVQIVEKSLGSQTMSQELVESLNET